MSPVRNGDILIELERTERWTTIMGPAGTVLEAPERSVIEDAGRRPGLAL